MTDRRSGLVRVRLGSRAASATTFVAAVAALALAGSVAACQPVVRADPGQTSRPSATPVDADGTGEPGSAEPTGSAGTGQPTSEASDPPPEPSRSAATDDVDGCRAMGGNDVCGPIYERYVLLGGPDGPLGEPTSDEFAAAAGAGRGSHFEGGDIYWSSATGAWEVPAGPILDDWNASGGAGGALGFPVAAPTQQGEGQAARFEHGTVAVSPSTGTHLVLNPADAAWQDHGGGAGSLGYPLLDDRPAVGADTVTFFQGGAVYVTGADVGVHEAPGAEGPAVDVPSAYGLALSDFLVVRTDRAADPVELSVLVWTTDGCSGPTPPNVDTLFADACLRHDFGYRNFLDGPAVDPSPQRRLAIDDQFHTDLRATCVAAGEPEVQWFGLRVTCDRAAQLMYDAVRAFGGA